MEICLILVLVLAFHAYLGYPAILAIFGRVLPHENNASHRPRVTVLVAAYNEIDVIESKIRNSLELRYPADSIEFVFASDGSDDGTTEVIEKYKGDRFHPVLLGPRGGKARALRSSLPVATGEIIILSDANTMIERNAVINLVRHFSDPKIGAVSGDVRIDKASGGFGESESLYYRIERYIQGKESESGSMMGVDGGLYALRKDLFRLPDDKVILDDFVVSMNVIRSGHRVLYEPDALASENATPSIGQEMRRKSRVIAGGFQALRHYGIVPPLSEPWLLFCFASHKLLRWILPELLLLLLIFNIVIVISGRWWGYTVVLCLQIMFYLLGIAGWWKEKRWKSPVFSVPFYFTMVNIAGFFGFFRFLTGGQKVTWKKADRVAVHSS